MRDARLVKIMADKLSVGVCGRNKGRVAPLLISLLLLGPGIGRAQDPVSNGVACLAATQNADGSWGDPQGTGLRDTTVAVDALRALAPSASALAQGISYLQNAVAPNQDYLARQMAALAATGSVATEAITSLLAGQQAENRDPSALNYPEGGWGVAPEFGTETLTTALGLRALNALGYPRGLSVVGAQVLAGSPTSHPFDLPSGATALVILIRQITGTVRLFIQTPTSGTFYLDLTNVTAPVNLVGLPVESGTYTLRVESQAGSPNTYSLEARFNAAGFDVSRITGALSYLGFTQNLDGGWGIGPDEDSLLMITAEALQTLASYGTAFAPSSRLAAGVSALAGQQHPDGGFGAEAGVSTVYETALAVLAIRVVTPTAAAIAPAQTFLLNTQGANGCWNDDPYQTALALRALPICRLDVDSNGIVDVATDVVYIARHLLGLPQVAPPSFRTLDPTIPPDAAIAANIDLVGTGWDVDGNGLVDVATDIVYLARYLLGLPQVVPPTFRALDPSIPPDATITATSQALCP